MASSRPLSDENWTGSSDQISRHAPPTAANASRARSICSSVCVAMRGEGWVLQITPPYSSNGYFPDTTLLDQWFIVVSCAAIFEM